MCPSGILIIGSVHLALLTASVYTLVLTRIYHGTRLRVVDIILLFAQAVNLTVIAGLLWMGTGYGTDAAAALDSAVWPYALQCGFMALVSSRFVMLYRGALARRQMLLMPRAIRETIDYLPGGLCFATPDGRPILTNHRMNELVYILTGRTVSNALSTWDELCDGWGGYSANQCAKLENLWGDAHVYYSLPDGSVWRFRRELLTDKQPCYIQLDASQITDLYRYSAELSAKNRQWAEQYARQRSILENIVEINREKEILQAKMRIHDDLGRSIITTRQHLTNQTLEANTDRLAEIWETTIRSLSVVTPQNEPGGTPPEAELSRAAEMIGCHIHMTGEIPANRRTVLLLCALVREALTNAVTHAGANRLDVAITPTARGYRVRITDNGNIRVGGVTEGSGLGNLREKLEREGAALDVSCARDGVVLTAELPADSRTAG